MSRDPRCVSRAFLTLLGAMALASCSTKSIVQTAREPPNPDASAPPCPATLAARLTQTDVDLPTNIYYKKHGYDYMPLDERIAFSVSANGTARVAWLDLALTHVHVTPLDASLMRSGDDVLIDGDDLGGLVSRDDGFGVLTRRTDPGQQLRDPNQNTIGEAVYFVRARGTREAVAVPLTGTMSITQATDSSARDCSSTPINARLEWNGAKYGAYFVIHGCDGDPHAGYYGDKLVYFDDDGRRLSGGFGWGCSIDEGLRLVPEPDVFTALCLADATPHTGLDLLIAGMPVQRLAGEKSADGYSAGQFGTAVKQNDGGYLIGWLSRGASDDSENPDAVKMATDIALMRLAADYSVVSQRTWLTDTPNVAEANLHLAPYGSDRVLVVWDSIEQLRCSNLTCFGMYSGTHARLIDASGTFVTSDAKIDAVPNTDDDIVVFPNGDLGWAYVPDDARTYAAPLSYDSRGQPAVAAKHRLRIARLRYCR